MFWYYDALKRLHEHSDRWESLGFQGDVEEPIPWVDPTNVGLSVTYSFLQTIISATSEDSAMPQVEDGINRWRGRFGQDDPDVIMLNSCFWVGAVTMCCCTAVADGQYSPLCFYSRQGMATEGR